MQIVEAFLVGFLLGVVGCLAILLLVKKRKCARPEVLKSENPTSDGATVGHDRGIEVFDD